MKEERIKELINKYKAGTTSTEDEVELQHNYEKLEPTHKHIFRFIQQQKTKAPQHFNEEQWQIFERKQKGLKAKRYAWISVAASIVLVVSLFLMKPNKDKMDLAQKQALLEEALLMIESSTEDNKQTILYEDELVIIYTSN